MAEPIKFDDAIATSGRYHSAGFKIGAKFMTVKDSAEAFFYAKESFQELADHKTPGLKLIAKEAFAAGYDAAINVIKGGEDSRQIIILWDAAWRNYSLSPDYPEAAINGR